MEHGILHFRDVENLFKEINGIKGAIYITDKNVYHFYKQYFDDDNTILIKSGESSKSLSVVSDVCDILLSKGANRNTFIVGIGGGVITDLTGFIASIFMRGVKFGFVSTTLLGMVDASIGGKNGVNLGGYKNIIGNINKPEFIYWSDAFLKTLPREELYNGMGEVAKYAVGFDQSLFKILYDLDIDNSNLSNMIAMCQYTKVDIVNKDLRETGIRKLLNLGHTIAHAIEKGTGFSIKHGQAVMIGLKEIARYSHEHYGLSSDQLEKINYVIDKYLTEKYDESLIRDVIEYVDADKKSCGDNKLDLIVVDRIGHCKIANTDLDDLKTFFK